MKKDANTFLDAMTFRFACKEFDPSRKISDEEFNKILEAGRLSPSSFGFEPWQFVVVQNPELREKISAVGWGVQKQMPSTSHLLLIYARKPSQMKATGEYLTKTIMEETQHMPQSMIDLRVDRFREFYTKDFGLSESDRIGFEWACRQAYLAMESMLLMAAFIGIDACPIEGFHKENLEAVLEKEGVLCRDVFGVACMVAFGYRAEGPTRPKARRKLEDVVTWVR